MIATQVIAIFAILPHFPGKIFAAKSHLIGEDNTGKYRGQWETLCM
jgi:hypothetical protein